MFQVTEISVATVAAALEYHSLSLEDTLNSWVSSLAYHLIAKHHVVRPNNKHLRKIRQIIHRKTEEVRSEIARLRQERVEVHEPHANPVAAVNEPLAELGANEAAIPGNIQEEPDNSADAVPVNIKEEPNENFNGNEDAAAFNNPKNQPNSNEDVAVDNLQGELQENEDVTTNNVSGETLAAAELKSSPSGSSTVNSDSPPAKRICRWEQRISFASFFNCQRSSDILFIVGQGEQEQRVYAHRLVLSVGSQVFNTMFDGNWSTGSVQVKIPDIEPPAFTDFLRFLYMDEVALHSDTVNAVLYVARKYAVQPLENLCVNFIVESLRADNAFKVLNQLSLFKDEKLINLCFDKIDEDTVVAVAADGFSNIDVKMLCSVLKRNTLTISEVELFKAILRWCKAECSRKNVPDSSGNLRSVIQEALPLIRFPLMSVEEFSSIVAHSGLLTNEELVSVYLYFTTIPRPPTDFNVTPRFAEKKLVVHRF